MDYPMRVYGLNLFEILLKDFLIVIAWTLFLFAGGLALLTLADVFWPDPVILRLFITSGVFAGILIGGTLAAGIIIGLASAGIRQNRSALVTGLGLLILLSIAWSGNGLYSRKIGALIVGIVLLIFYVLVVLLHKQAIKARFSPRFFNLREFETVIQVADTMIDADGKEVLHPIQVAINIDHLFHKIDSPHRTDIKRVLLLVEWLLPLLIWRPFPFSVLGSNERRRVVEKVIGARGIFRDVARTLKMLACVGYYGSYEGMAQVGFIPFAERQRSQGVDQNLQFYPEPLTREGVQ